MSCDHTSLPLLYRHLLRDLPPRPDLLSLVFCLLPSLRTYHTFSPRFSHKCKSLQDIHTSGNLCFFCLFPPERTLLELCVLVLLSRPTAHKTLSSRSPWELVLFSSGLDPLFLELCRLLVLLPRVWWSLRFRRFPRKEYVGDDFPENFMYLKMFCAGRPLNGSLPWV